MGDKSKVQGEGNYDAARDYDRETSAHAKDEAAVRKQAEAAKKALDGAERADLEAAENVGASHARGYGIKATRTLAVIAGVDRDQRDVAGSSQIGLCGRACPLILAAAAGRADSA
jgi:hypothetical protein